MEEINLEGEVHPKKDYNKTTRIVIGVFMALVIIAVIVTLAVLSTSESKPKLEITSSSLSVEYNEYLGYSAKVTGVAKNTTNKNYSYASLEFSVYDASGNNLGTAWANINNLASGDTWRFEATLLQFPDSRPATYKLVEITVW